VSGGWKTAARPPKSAPDPPVSAPFRRKTCRTALCLRCPRPISYLRRASLEAAQEEGKRLGRAEMMPKVIDMKKQFGKIIDGIEQETKYKAPGRPRKLPRKGH
jgi:hypothetical protein